jgi:hypothetical protein
MGVILRYNDFLKTYKTRSHRINHLVNYEKWFPVNASETLAGIVGDLVSDGSLQGEDKWRIDFTSKSIDELKRFENEVYYLFKIRGKVRRCTSNKYKTYNLGINCSPLARVLFLCGVPAGNKVKQDFYIPLWILNNRKYFKRFTQRFFTCEGSVIHDNKKRLQIRACIWKSEKNLKSGIKFITDISAGLKKFFGIESKISVLKRFLNQKDNTLRLEIRIYLYKPAAIKFCKAVGFEGEKQKKLEKIMGCLSNNGDLSKIRP